jgi:hypothetical protein
MPGGTGVVLTYTAPSKVAPAAVPSPAQCMEVGLTQPGQWGPEQAVVGGQVHEVVTGIDRYPCTCGLGRPPAS